MKGGRMNIKVSVSTLRKCGILIIGYKDDEELNLNQLPQGDRDKYYRYLIKEEQKNEQERSKIKEA